MVSIRSQLLVAMTISEVRSYTNPILLTDVENPEVSIVMERVLVKRRELATCKSVRREGESWAH